MFGIESYYPHFYTDTKEIIKELGLKLSNIKDKRIIDVLVVWDTKNENWFKDCPVVLNIEGIQLELCANKIDELSITFNTIDMSQKIDWYGIDEFKLEWRKEPFSDLLLAKGKKIKNIELIEYNYQTVIVYSKDNLKSVGDQNSSWILNGIGFELEDGYFSVCNGLDENEISIKPETSDSIRTIKLFKK